MTIAELEADEYADRLDMLGDNESDWTADLTEAYIAGRTAKPCEAEIRADRKT